MEVLFQKCLFALGLLKRKLAQILWSLKEAEITRQWKSTLQFLSWMKCSQLIQRFAIPGLFSEFPPKNWLGSLTFSLPSLQKQITKNLKSYSTSVWPEIIFLPYYLFSLQTFVYPASRPAHVKTYSLWRPSLKSRDEFCLPWRVSPGSLGAWIQFPISSYHFPSRD